MFVEDFNIQDYHSWYGVLISYIIALILFAFMSVPFMGLVYSQMLLSVQLPITIELLVYLTSSRRVMGKFVNTLPMKVVLILIGVIVGVLNLALLWQALTT